MKSVDQEKIDLIKNFARKIRISIIEMLVSAGSGHTAGALGMADIFSVLYFHHLRHNSKNPKWEDRDRLVLSNGHICPVLYASLAHAGYFDIAELNSLRKFGSRLQGHPHREFLDLVETSSGPLGSGLSQSVGMAIADKMNRNKSIPKTIYCITSDGEHNEGNTWEAIMLAGKERLDNLVCIIDRNNIQIDGFTENIMPLESLYNKYITFGWNVIEIDGNNIIEIIDALERARDNTEKPVVIIAHTVPGKGVSFIENKYEWHGKPPTKAESDLAIKEILE